MKVAEKKLDLYQVILNADEQGTGKLFELALRLTREEAPTPEDVAFFEKRRKDFFASGEQGISRDDLLSMLKKEFL